MVRGQIAWPALVALVLAGCESSTRVDCPALEVDACLDESVACTWAWPKEGGDCRNRCESDDCEEGLACIETRIYDGSVEAENKHTRACSVGE